MPAHPAHGDKDIQSLDQGGRIYEQQSALEWAGARPGRLRAWGENVTGAQGDPPPYRYRIRVRGRLGETICSAFPALRARGSGADTVLTGALPDRAALYGVLAEIEALGLDLLEVRRLPRAGSD